MLYTPEQGKLASLAFYYLRVKENPSLSWGTLYPHTKHLLEWNTRVIEFIRFISKNRACMCMARGNDRHLTID